MIKNISMVSLALAIILSIIGITNAKAGSSYSIKIDGFTDIGDCEIVAMRLKREKYNAVCYSNLGK